MIREYSTPTTNNIIIFIIIFLFQSSLPTISQLQKISYFIFFEILKNKQNLDINILQKYLAKVQFHPSPSLPRNTHITTHFTLQAKTANERRNKDSPFLIHFFCFFPTEDFHRYI